MIQASLAAILFTMSAFASPNADVALATSISGDVTFSTESAPPSELVPFSKVRRGDNVTIADSGSLELMYFDDGHSETFVGPAQFVMGNDATPTSRSDGNALVGEALKNLPGLMRRAELDKGGHAMVRGNHADPVPLDDEEIAEIAVAKTQYDAMRAAAKDNDILPEMFLSTVYLSYGQNAEAVTLLKGAAARCADCPGPAKLLSWLDKAQ